MAPIAIACYKTLKEKAAEDAKPKPGSADRFGYVVSLLFHRVFLRVSAALCDVRLISPLR